jgi:hypothetical protein
LAQKDLLGTKFFPETRDHSKINSSERTVETREEVLRFQMESLMPDLPKQLKLRGCDETVHKHSYLLLKPMPFLKLDKN